jgi:hypothetical protein
MYWNVLLKSTNSLLWAQNQQKAGASVASLSPFLYLSFFFESFILQPLRNSAKTEVIDSMFIKRKIGPQGKKEQSLLGRSLTRQQWLACLDLIAPFKWRRITSLSFYPLHPARFLFKFKAYVCTPNMDESGLIFPFPWLPVKLSWGLKLWFQHHFISTSMAQIKMNKKLFNISSH